GRLGRPPRGLDGGDAPGGRRVRVLPATDRGRRAAGERPVSRADQAGHVRAVVVRIERGMPRRRTTLLAHRARPFAEELREEILAAQEGTLSIRRLFA